METKKHSEVKIIIKFIAIILASGALGFGASMLMGHLTGGEGVQLQGLGEILGAAVPAVFLLSNLVMAAVSLVMCRSAKRQVRDWDGDDESVEKIEHRLNYPMLFANLMTVLNFLFFSASIQVAETTAFGAQYGTLLFPLCLATFVLGYVWILFVSNRVVRLEEQLNPEKRGNIFDIKFQKQWIGSCDEAEKQKIYQAGFRGYRAGSTACLILWVVTTFAQLWAGTGILPVVCVCLIWLVMMTASMIESIRLEKH